MGESHLNYENRSPSRIGRRSIPFLVIEGLLILMLLGLISSLVRSYYAMDLLEHCSDGQNSQLFSFENGGVYFMLKSRSSAPVDYHWNYVSWPAGFGGWENIVGLGRNRWIPFRFGSRRTSDGELWTVFVTPHWMLILICAVLMLYIAKRQHKSTLSGMHAG
jgi:hypothetical protein